MTELQANNKQSSNDSFELNMKKMEKTNKLLDSIESKLTDFFGSKKNPTEISEKAENSFNSSLNASHQLRPITEEPSTRRTRSNSPGLVRPPTEPSEERNIHQATFGRPEELQLKKLSASLQLQSDAHLYDSKLLPQANRSANLRPSFTEDLQPRPSAGVDFLDRMNRLEETYQNKIRILEERIRTAEQETKQTLTINGQLMAEIQLVRKEATGSQEKFAEELRKKLFEQEERLSHVYDEKLKIKDEAIAIIQQQVISGEDRYAALRDEYESLLQKCESMAQKNEEIEKEKNSLLEKYQSLMNVHNEMIQLDIQKNMRLSQSNSSFFNFSQRQDAAAEANRLKLEESAQEIQELVEAIELYRKELQNLKANNTEIHQTFETEIERLRNELKLQKEQNFKLVEKLRLQQSLNQQLVKALESEQKLHDADGKHDESEEEVAEDVKAHVERKGFESTRKLHENLKELEEQTKENINQLNKVYEQVYPGEGKRHMSDAMNESHDLPFTNPSIKNSLSKAKKSVPRDVFAEESDTEEAKPAKAEKLREKPQRSESQRGKNLSASTESLHDIEDEFRKLKALADSKMPAKNSNKKSAAKLNTKVAKASGTKSEVEKKTKIDLPKAQSKKRLF